MTKLDVIHGGKSMFKTLKHCYLPGNILFILLLSILFLSSLKAVSERVI